MSVKLRPPSPETHVKRIMRGQVRWVDKQILNWRRERRKKKKAEEEKNAPKIWNLFE